MIKKTFVTTSSFILSAALLSQIYSFASVRLQSNTVNLSAFEKLSENIQTVAAAPAKTTVISEDTVITNDIIKVIDKEITKKIKHSKFIVKSVKPKTVLMKPAAALAAVKLDLDQKEISKTDDLSSYEINNKGLINLYSMSVESTEYSTFESIKLAANYNEEIQKEIQDEVVVGQASTAVVATFPTISDEVSLAQLATERKEDVVSESLVKESTKEDEDMVMFDYSDKKAATEAPKTFDQKLYERPISNTVKQAISREIGNYPIKKLVAPSTQNTETNPLSNSTVKIDGQDIELDLDNGYEYSHDKVKTSAAATDKAVKDAVKEMNGFMEPKEMNTHFTVLAKEINLDTHKIKQAHSFEFIPDYDRAERTDDHSNGEINFDYSLAGDMNTQTGIIQAQGMISTRIELKLNESKAIEVPLINEEGIQAFLQKQKLSIQGNLILLALNPSIVDTEIDSRFAQRFFFDKHFRPLSLANGATYVLYAGVKTGNIMVRYLLSNKDSAQKIIFVGDGEMFFDDPQFSAGNRETFTFTTRSLLGQKQKELVIDGGDISFFNTNLTARKKALNAYEIKVPTLTGGMRKYLEFKHLKDSVFVGSAGEKDIEVPGNDFIAKVLEMNDVGSLKDRCVVQINLTKDLLDFKANGKNRSGEMFVEKSYLDKEGSFSRDADLAEKAFIVGDLEGQFNVRLDYQDGSTEFLKTFCSQGTYLIEQL